MAVSVLKRVDNQTAYFNFSMNRKEMPKSMINPITPTKANLINDEFKKT